MSTFIHQTLMLLEDAGMLAQYPRISHVTLEQDGKSTMHSRHSLMLGMRVSIQQNPHIEFLMLFTLLDFHVDATYPDMEGKSYLDKCKDLPVQGDFNIMLRQLYRVAKVIRNALVHNQSSLTFTKEHVNVDYRRGKHQFALKMSLDSFSSFRTAIVMYVKGDMGKGNYFLGLMRSFYGNIVAGTSEFSDELSSSLERPSSGLKMKRSVRQVVMNPPYESCGVMLRFPFAEREIPDWEGMDIYLVKNGEEFLVPREALDENMSILESELIADWKRNGHFPPIMKLA